MREIILADKDDDDKDDKEQKTPEQMLDDAMAKSEADSSKDMKAFTESLMAKRLDKQPPKRAHRKSHGKVAFTVLAKTVGLKWREMSEEKKKRYKDLAEIDRERYRKEKSVIGKQLREEAKKQRREAKKIKLQQNS